MAAVAAAQGWFPAVGLILGASLVALDRLATRALPEPTTDVILVVALVALTGALHLDGLADAADGLLGGHDPRRRLEIMRDTHTGAFGVVAIVSVLALKVAGLNALPRDVRFESLLLVPCAARFSAVLVAAAFPYARAEGIGVAFHALAWPRGLLAAAATAAAAALVLLGPAGLTIVAFAAACAIAGGWFATRMVGGMTGDLYGATIETSEALLFLFVAAIANRGWLGGWALA